MGVANGNVAPTPALLPGHPFRLRKRTRRSGAQPVKARDARAPRALSGGFPPFFSGLKGQYRVQVSTVEADLYSARTSTFKPTSTVVLGSLLTVSSVP